MVIYERKNLSLHNLKYSKQRLPVVGSHVKSPRIQEALLSHQPHDGTLSQLLQNFRETNAELSGGGDSVTGQILFSG